jgi:hypothetical protein
LSANQPSKQQAVLSQSATGITQEYLSIKRLPKNNFPKKILVPKNLKAFGGLTRILSDAMVPCVILMTEVSWSRYMIYVLFSSVK